MLVFCKMGVGTNVFGQVWDTRRESDVPATGYTMLIFQDDLRRMHSFFQKRVWGEKVRPHFGFKTRKWGPCDGLEKLNMPRQASVRVLVFQKSVWGEFFSPKPRTQDGTARSWPWAKEIQYVSAGLGACACFLKNGCGGKSFRTDLGHTTGK